MIYHSMAPKVIYGASWFSSTLVQQYLQKHRKLNVLKKVQQYQIVWLAFLILFQSAGALYMLINKVNY